MASLLFFDHVCLLDEVSAVARQAGNGRGDKAAMDKAAPFPFKCGSVTAPG